MLPPSPQWADLRAQYGIVVGCLTAFFALVFYGTWLCCSRFERLSPVWSKLSRAERADWCSRTNSQIHAAFICPALIATMATVYWDPIDYEPLSPNVANVRFAFSVSAAYFTFDLFVLVLYRVPLWPVFVAHHVVAMVPIYFQLFRLDCQQGTLILGLFLLVEFANLTYNVQSWSETLGYGKATTMNAVWYYATLALWFASRIVLPVFCVVEWWRHVVFRQRLPNMAMDCVVLETFAGHFIQLFCTVVFFGVLMPELVKRCRGDFEREAEEAAKRPSDLEVGGMTEPIAPVAPSSFGSGVADRPEAPPANHVAASFATRTMRQVTEPGFEQSVGNHA